MRKWLERSGRLASEREENGESVRRGEVNSVMTQKSQGFLRLSTCILNTFSILQPDTR